MSNSNEYNDTNNNLIKGFLYEKQIKDYIINNLQKMHIYGLKLQKLF